MTILVKNDRILDQFELWFNKKILEATFELNSSFNSHNLVCFINMCAIKVSDVGRVGLTGHFQNIA